VNVDLYSPSFQFRCITILFRLSELRFFCCIDSFFFVLNLGDDDARCVCTVIDFLGDNDLGDSVVVVLLGDDLLGDDDVADFFFFNFFLVGVVFVVD